MTAATSEKAMQPAPRPFREDLTILRPVRNNATVIPASTSDIAIMANQYSTSNSEASNEDPPAFNTRSSPSLAGYRPFFPINIR